MVRKICAFVFAYAECLFFHEVAHLLTSLLQKISFLNSGASNFRQVPEKAQVGNDQENQKEITTPKTEVEKNLIDNQALIRRKHIVSRVSSYFSIGGHSVSGT